MGRYMDPCMGSMKNLVLLAVSCPHSFKEDGRGLWFPQAVRVFPSGYLGLWGDHASASGVGTEAQLHTVSLVNLRSFLLETSVQVKHGLVVLTQKRIQD